MIKDLPEKLRKLRIKHGLTQKQAAIRIGVSPSIISGYETGERTPSMESLLSLAYLYNCSTDYLLGKRPPQSRQVLNTDGLTDQQVRALNYLIEAIRSS